MSKRESVLTRQLSLDLQPREARKPGTRGGARPGAGRPRKKASERSRAEHCARPSHRKGDPVHVTLKVGRRIPSLRRQVLARLAKVALLKQRKKLEAAAEGKFQVVHFTIQDDHMHLIVEANDKRTLARGLMGLEIRIARSLNEALGRKGRFWAERYHRHDLRTPAETRNALRYVLANLQKHYRGFGDRAFADPSSSAATFDGYTRPPILFEDAQRWPHVRPRTWLLNTGWRRYGLLDPADMPPSSRWFDR